MFRITGGYKATRSRDELDRREVGHAEAGWSTDLAAEEFRSLTRRGVAGGIARKTGGEISAASWRVRAQSAHKPRQ
jgi:hypothetical protein